MNRVLFFLLTILLYVSGYAALTVPTLVSPADNETGLGTSVSLYVTANGGTELLVEYAENASMTNAKQIITTKTSSGLFTKLSKLKLGTSYFWRVKLRSATDSSAWSGIRKFTTDASFRAYYPDQDRPNLVGSIIYLSTYTVFGYDSILFQVDTSTSFNSGWLRNTVKLDTGNAFYVETQEYNFSYGQTYYWRACAFAGSQATNWTTTRLFSFIDSIKLKYPSTAFAQPVAITFEWTTGSNTEPFQVQIDTVPTFTNPVIDTIAANGTRRFYPDPFTVPNLKYETPYFYRVRTFNAVDTTKWTYSSFTTDGFGFSDLTDVGNFIDPETKILARRTIAGSSGYEIQLDKLADFSSNQLQVIRYLGADTMVSHLLFGQTYYVRSRPYHAMDSGNWGRSRSVGVNKYPNLIKPSLTGTNVGLRDSLMFYDMDGVDGYQVQVAVNGDYTSKMFLDTILVDTANPNFNYIKGHLFKLNTTYKWRIRAWHILDTSDWSLSDEFTTITSPTLQLPHNSTFVGAQAATNLEWKAVKGATAYQVMLDTTADFSSPLAIDTTVSDRLIPLENLLFRPLYYWKVRILTDDDTSAWSDTWVFKVLSASLNSPSNNIKNFTLNSLDWNSITGTLGYILQIDSLPDFSAPITFTDTVKNSFFHYFHTTPAYIDFNTKYYWRVKLYHALDTSDWSKVWNFTTIVRRAPTLISPVDSSEDVPVFATLKWAAYSGAASYAIERSENPNFTSATKLTTTATSINITLKANTRYYWRVRGRNSDGQEFYDWSKEWTFTTNGGIEAPLLISPTNGATNQAKNVVLRWNKHVNATSYRVELSLDSNFVGAYANTVTSTTTAFNQIVEGKTYYWRVRTLAGTFTSPWSEKWKLTIAETTGIASIDKSRLKVYPNPVSSTLYLETESVKISSIRITNNLGMDVLSVPSGSIEIDISSLPCGTYTLHLLQNEEWVRQLFVVQR